MTAWPGAGEAVLVCGSAGGLGAALLRHHQQHCPEALTLGLHRRSDPPLELLDETCLAHLADRLRTQLQATGRQLTRVWICTGFLHGPAGEPERSLAQLDARYLQHCFAVNTVGPALLLKHLAPLLPPAPHRVLVLGLSARVGSLGDNRLGGWTGYRASKAGLNMVLRNVALEWQRRFPQRVVVALHPGTVDTGLSAPFAKSGLTVRPPAVAAAELFSVAESLGPAESGGFLDHHRVEVPW